MLHNWDEIVQFISRESLLKDSLKIQWFGNAVYKATKRQTVEVAISSSDW